MTNEPKQVPQDDPSEAQPGRGAPGDNHYGVQTAQPTAVNAPDAIIPSGAPAELSEHQVEELEEEEDEEGGFHTTDGYVVDEAGMLNNFAIEPPMYVEGEEPPGA